MKYTNLAIVFGLLSPFSANAFRLTPMVVHFAESGPKSTQVLTLENTAAEKIPVQIEVKTRAVTLDGKEVREPTSDFVVYPEQIVLLPNEKRNIRITWNGTEKIQTEKSFRIIASQLPLEFREKNSAPKGGGAALNFLIQYVASAYVSPLSGLPKIKVQSVKIVKPRSLEIVLANEGNVHQVMKLKALQLWSKASGQQSEPSKPTLELKAVKELESENILANSQRKFVVALPEDWKGREVRARLELEDFED